MKALFLVCNRYKSYNIKKSSNIKIAIPSSSKKRMEVMRNCLGIFICIESFDSFKEAKRCLNDIKECAKKNKIRNILLAPFSHLSHRLASPQKSIEIILSMEEELRKAKFNVFRSSFGFQKNLFLDIKGCKNNIMWRSYIND